MSGQTEAEQADGRVTAAVVARGITMRGPWGPVYGPIDLDIEAGGVTVLVCPAGSGRTALLMTLAGRMRPVSGDLEVCGRRRTRDIFANAALAGIDELDDVSESVTVRNLVTEQLRWDADWYRLVKRADRLALESVCAPVFGTDLQLPPLDEYFEELSELDRMLLRIALANTQHPELLVVADIDRVTSTVNHDLLIERLVALGRTQTVVTATVNGATGHDVRAQLLVPNVTRPELAGLQNGGR